MLLRLHKALSKNQLDSLLELGAELGYQARLHGPEFLELTNPEGGAPEHRALFEQAAGVAEIMDASDAPELHERKGGPGTLVHVADAIFGDGHVALIGGPCAVEEPARLLEIARAVHAGGATLLRGGAFKPRTSPYAYQGLGRPGLEHLAAAARETGLGIVTEVLDPRDVDAVGRVCDMFQIGSRSMNNFALLREVGRTNTPVLLKRGFASTVREFLLAAEYVLAEGNPNVVLCERGIRSFDNVTRNVLDVGAVAHLKRATHLPVIVDPSHAAGRADLVRPLARAGLAAGADGLIIEVHSAPDETRSDSAQAVSPAVFAEIANDARSLAALDDRKFVGPRASGNRREETVA